MKKFAIMLTAVMCICVSCGEKNNSESTSEPVQDTTIVTEVITDVPEKISERDGGYDEVINSYKKCMEINNVGNMMKLSYPDRYFEIFSFMAEISGMTVEEVMGTIQSYADNTIRMNEIISDETVDNPEDIMDILIENYGDYQIISDYIDEQGGMEKVDTEKFNEFMDSAEYDSENIKLYFKPENIHRIKCEMESFTKGEESEAENYEQEFIVYYIDGEGWKIDTYLTEE